MIKKIEPDNRQVLYQIFKDCKYDRVLVDSVLEGNYGTSHAIVVDGEIKTGRLDSGAFTILAGDSKLREVADLINLNPIEVVTPQDAKWEQILKETYKDHVIPLNFGEMDSSGIRLSHLKNLVQNVPEGYTIHELNNVLATKAQKDLNNEYLYENFSSMEDFLTRGLGFCILHNDTVVSAATSVARSREAIDIEIETHSAYRRQGLAAVVGAKLILASKEAGLTPKWLAANAESEKLAMKLGYTKVGEYYSFLIETEEE